MKRKKNMPKDCLLRDHPRRLALLKFLKATIPERPKDSRIGLIAAQAWLAGYNSGLRRGRRAHQP